MLPVDRGQSRATPGVDQGLTPKHHPSTPLPQTDKICRSNHKKRSESAWSVDGEDGSVLCSKCRPHSREKIIVVPMDNNGSNKQSPSLASPNGIFKFIFSPLTRKSPKSTEAMSTSREEQWKIALAELSNKLIQATRKRDEAISESSRLKYSMAELEKKLNRLEMYCHKLKSGLDECSNNSPYRMAKTQNFHENDVVEHFMVAVSEARSSVRLLSRSLIMQLRHMGGKVHERVSLLLQAYDIKISFSNNSRSLLFYLEALLNKAFYEDFESVRFQKNASNFILNPEERCEVNFASFNMLHGLTWEEVLCKGTRHFSEEYSRFCDRKMSEIVAMLGWNRAWPEPLLQAFFGASKSVWLVHLLANSVHPSLPIFRVDKGVRFDPVYMEDMSGDKSNELVSSMVRIMISPGFYVSSGVVKCKVLCKNFSSNGHYHSNVEDKGSTPLP
ncbi:IRK-interacting protein-like [Neltuma alba]|uniref:IRK-interacting protein-like n=1 Tax=Neltuma alba TaxID=207710 RepID=UPI0010A3EC11|nr:IRK-interacting protein-like [Prosopis alba]